MDDHDRPPKPPFHDTLAALSWVRFLAHAVAAPHEFLARKLGSMGREYAGSPARVVGLLVVPWLAVLIVPPTYGAEWLPVYAGVLLLAAAAHAVARSRRRSPVHRHYVGDALVGGGERRWGEVAVGLPLALLLFAACPTLGAVHLASVLCSRAVLAELRARDRRVVEKMRDARTEAAYYAARLRDED